VGKRPEVVIRLSDRDAATLCRLLDEAETDDPSENNRVANAVRDQVNEQRRADPGGLGRYRTRATRRSGT
jgi:hypothetical protein